MATMTSESFEKWSSGVKNVVQTIFMLFVVVALLSTKAQLWLGSELNILAASGVESLKIGELEFKLKQAQKAVLQVANNPPAAPAGQLTTKPQDKAMTPGLAPALEAASTPGTFWVYLGQYQSGKFLNAPNFGSGNLQMPKEGDVINAATDTYERATQPVKIGTEWKLGNIVGVVRQGRPIIARQVVTIEDGNVWLHADDR